MRKAPDKIYVYIPRRLNMSAFKEDSKYVGMAYIDKKSTTPSQIEEYIRKDALMEWAEKGLKGLKGLYDLAPSLTMVARMEVLQDLIDELNSL